MAYTYMHVVHYSTSVCFQRDEHKKNVFFWFDFGFLVVDFGRVQLFYFHNCCIGFMKERKCPRSKKHVAGLTRQKALRLFGVSI